MRISDWSSDVCSSDLDRRHRERFQYIDDSFGRAIAPLAVVAGKGGDRALAILGAEIDEHQQCRPDVQRVGERRGERAVEEAAQKAGIDQAVDIGRQPHRVRSREPRVRAGGASASVEASVPDTGWEAGAAFGRPVPAYGADSLSGRMVARLPPPER